MKTAYIAPTKHIVNVRQGYSADFVLSEWGEWLCAHREAYIEKACCNGFDSEGNQSCGCGGVDGIICPAQDCTGIEGTEVEALYEKIVGGQDHEG